MKKTLVVFIHGIGVENTKWWGSTIASFKNDQELENAGISVEFWEYDTKKLDYVGNKFKQFFNKHKKLPSLDDVGHSFLGKFEDKKDIDKYEQILLFGHSMGGLVASTLLIHAFNNDNKHEKFKEKIRSLVMCGTPLGGSLVADKLRILSNLYNISSEQMQELYVNSNTISDIQNKLKNIINLECNDITKPCLEFFKLSQDEVVQTDDERYGIFIDEVQPIDTLEKGHSPSIQNLTIKKDNYKKIKRWMKNHAEKVNDSVVILPNVDTSFDSVISELKHSLQVGGSFNTFNEKNEISNESLLRIFLQKILHATTIISKYNIGSANIWVSHFSNDSNDNTIYLRSEERDGYFSIDQLMARHGNYIIARNFPLSLHIKDIDNQPIAARSAISDNPIIEKINSGDVEKNLGITHILGIPLCDINKFGEEKTHGIPLSITVDLKITNVDIKEVEKLDIINKAKKIKELFDSFNENCKILTMFPKNIYE